MLAEATSTLIGGGGQADDISRVPAYLHVTDGILQGYFKNQMTCRI